MQFNNTSGTQTEILCRAQVESARPLAAPVLYRLGSFRVGITKSNSNNGVMGLQHNGAAPRLGLL